MRLDSTPAYRLLACDLDGTLMDDTLSISPRVRRALALAQARGVQVTLATGRGFPSTLPFARDLNITAPLICYQGGLIKHPQTGQELYRATMEPDLMLQVIETARARRWSVVAYLGDDIFVEDFARSRDFYYEMLGRDIHVVQDLAETVRNDGKAPAKFITVAGEAESDRIQVELSALFGRQMTVVRSHKLFVEGNPQNVNKGHALCWLAEYLGVSQAQVMAIGDQGNDVAMIQWAGLGVAMGSGSQAARAVADWIAPPLEADGAAVAIERFLIEAQTGFGE
jgi:hypothetical protein